MTETVKQDVLRIANSEIAWEAFDGKSVLVTGATGFIGSFIVRALLQRVKSHGEKIRVIAMVRNEAKADKVFADYKGEALEYLIGDVTEPVDSKLNPDIIIHCASNAAPDQYAADPVGTIKINFYGTMNMLEFAQRVNAESFLYVSTIEVYGKTENLETIGEEDFGYISSSNPRSCYPESKKACENLVFCFGKQYGLKTMVGRLSYIYGAGMSRTDSKVCAFFARQVAMGQDIVLKSEGKQLRSYTYVSDAITGLLTVAAKGEAGQAYNIASSTSRITIVDMARKYCELFPEKNSSVKFDLPGDYEKNSFSFIANAVLDSTKLEGLGWKGEVELEDGLRYVVVDYLEG